MKKQSFFVLHPETEAFYRALLKDFLETAWKDCFTDEPIEK